MAVKRVTAIFNEDLEYVNSFLLNEETYFPKFTNKSNFEDRFEGDTICSLQ